MLDLLDLLDLEPCFCSRCWACVAISARVCAWPQLDCCTKHLENLAGKSGESNSCPDTVIIQSSKYCDEIPISAWLCSIQSHSSHPTLEAEVLFCHLQADDLSPVPHTLTAAWQTHLPAVSSPCRQHGTPTKIPSRNQLQSLFGRKAKAKCK